MLAKLLYIFQWQQSLPRLDRRSKRHTAQIEKFKSWKYGRKSERLENLLKFKLKYVI